MSRHDAASRALGLCALAAAMILGGAAQAATINVPTDQATIQLALDVAGANDIVLEAGYAATNEALTVNETGETIAGNAKTIASVNVTATGGAIIDNLTITNTNAAVGSHVIVNGGTLVINNGTISATNAAGAANSCAVNVLGGGSLTINGSTGTSTMVNGEFISLYTGTLRMTNTTITANTGAGMFGVGLALATGGAIDVNIDGCTFTTTKNCMRTNAANVHSGPIVINNSTFNAIAPAGTGLVVNPGSQNVTLTATHSTFKGGTNNAVLLNGIMSSSFNDCVLETNAANVSSLYVNAAYNGSVAITTSTLRSNGPIANTTGLFWAAVPGSTLSLTDSVLNTSGNGILVGANWPWNNATTISDTQITCETGIPFDYEPATGTGDVSLINCDLVTGGNTFGILYRGPQTLNVTDSSVQTLGQAIWSNIAANHNLLRTTFSTGATGVSGTGLYLDNPVGGTTTFTDCTVTDNNTTGTAIYKLAGALMLNNTDVTNANASGVFFWNAVDSLSITDSAITTTNGSPITTLSPSVALTRSDFSTLATVDYDATLYLQCGAGNVLLTDCTISNNSAQDTINSWFRPAIAPVLMTGTLALDGCTVNTDLSAIAGEGFLDPAGPQPSRLIIDNSTINAKGIGVMMARNGGTSWTMENTVINATTGNYAPASDAAVYVRNAQLYAKNCTIKGVNAIGGATGLVELDNTDVIGGNYGIVGFAGSEFNLVNGCTVSTATQALYLAQADGTTFTASNSVFNMGFNGQNLGWQSAITKMATSCSLELTDCVINGSGGTALALNPGGYPYMAGVAGPAWKISGTTIGNAASIFRSNAGNQLDFYDCHLDQSALSGVRDGTIVNVTSTTMQSAGTMFLVEQPGHESIPYVNTFNITSSTLSTYPSASPVWNATGSSITLNRIFLTASDLRTSNGAILDQADSAIQTTATHCRFTGGSNAILFRGRPLLGVQNGLLVDQCDFYNTDATTVMWAQAGTTGNFLFRDSILNGNIYNGVPGGAANAGVATVQNCVASVPDPLQVGTAGLGVNKFGADPKYYSVAYGNAQYLGLWSDSPAWQFNSGQGGPENYCGAVGKVANVPSAVRNWVLY